MSDKIYLDAPVVGDLEKKALCDAIDTGFVSMVGPLVGQFEQRMATHLGVARAVSTQSGTSAIHIGLHELGIGPGDEVIVPVLTFIASVNPIRYVGATPVFVDVDPLTWNIDTDQLAAAITPRTRALLPVHLYGAPCNLDAVMAMSQRHGIPVIEDATESLGASYRGRATGTMGELGCFSFNGNKAITTGGGGLVIGRDIKRLEHIHFLVNQARDATRGYYHPEIGFNYRMTNIEAALGLAQMERFPELQAARLRFAGIYRSRLAGIAGLRFQQSAEGGEPSHWLTCIAIDRPGFDSETLRMALFQEGIPSRRLFMPISGFPPYQQFAMGRQFPVAESLYRTGLCLPSSPLNSEAAIQRVCDRIIHHLGGAAS